MTRERANWRELDEKSVIYGRFLQATGAGQRSSSSRLVLIDEHVIRVSETRPEDARVVPVRGTIGRVTIVLIFSEKLDILCRDL